MKALAVVGASETGKTTLIERLVDRLDERGSVATIKHLDHAPDIDTHGKDTARHRDAGAAVTYGVDDEGWFATGDARDLDEILDDLAPDHDYAIVEGFSGRHLPAVVLGDRDHAGRELASADDADGIDLDAVCTAIDDLEPRVTLESLVEKVKSAPNADRSGAIATFTGRVRTKDADDDAPTEHLEFETYEGVAEERLAAIIDDLEAREGVQRVLAHHRTGVITSGEDIVFVVVLAGHREEAFATVSDGIDRLKDEVPIFKKEVTADEQFWLHERA
ncbi:molybdopterin synthase [Halococcus saccharolyticus]|uniref:Bifunctional molybdopterin-guanine dinucleotide biosynthesis protein MobB/MoaE n=1 Tax=Halococcus saccharolyticus DSM 5350 TaxID=1227455 RepID=M0MET7_9EURY|nr:molybdopterin synthase [Halococcus saccharolyticus]EMA43853.1 bifunctional molybdopterin-guanine dinucleotide biosynthesis protein MobB/MoaE [Halococcus saccharolyticus DSM 5350]